MDIMKVMQERHTVRNYLDKAIPLDIRDQLRAEVDKVNAESGLHMQLIFDEPGCFQTGMSRYGSFSGVQNYLAIVGKKSPDLEERAGYYGTKIVLFAQSIGLNSCWVALTHGKSKAVINKGEKEAVLVTLGYGVNQGHPHPSKPISELCRVSEPVPDWFKRGMIAAALAPTAVNQQKFLITYDGQKLKAEIPARGWYTKIDLGIVKCSFELASGHTFDE